MTKWIEATQNEAIGALFDGSADVQACTACWYHVYVNHTSGGKQVSWASGREVLYSSCRRWRIKPKPGWVSVSQGARVQEPSICEYKQFQVGDKIRLGIDRYGKVVLSATQSVHHRLIGRVIEQNLTKKEFTVQVPGFQVTFSQPVHAPQLWVKRILDE